MLQPRWFGAVHIAASNRRDWASAACTCWSLHCRLPATFFAAAGEVEYAELLEIMTLQLTRLAEQKEQEAAAAARQPAGAAAGQQGSVSGAAAGSGTSSAAVLPFDIVATAYRRKKLIGALEEDDKD
jgi:hypothetical protein